MRRGKKGNRSNKVRKDLTNGQIRFPRVMIIGDDGPIGEMTSREAQAMATEQNLDLVCISPNAKPPVCKICDYGKFRFDQAKKDKNMRQNQKTQEEKEVRLRPNIDVGDVQTKANNAIKFLSQGNKVKVSMQFRGRENAHKEIGKDVLLNFADVCKEVGEISKPPHMNGRFLDMYLIPLKKKK